MLVASVGCAVAPSFAVLIAARIVQGVGAALVVPSSLALLNGTLRMQDRAPGIGIWAGLASLGGLLIGPFVGGWLVDHASWRAVFLLNVPLVGAAVLALLRVPESVASRGRFSLDAVREVRERIPGVNVLVHPECRFEVVEAADYVGSTEYIIKTLDAAPAGSKWAIGTELNLVRRLANQHPDKQISFLERNVCYCSTMNRIDLPHLVWALEELVAGRVPNQITVDEDTAHHARVALDQMLALP